VGRPALVRRHFARRVSYLLYQNLSRLAGQWEESINATLWGIEREARRRLDELMGTIEKLERLREARQSIPQKAAERAPGKAAETIPC
jgi:hypothetical protein